MKTILFCRVSSKEQEETGYSLPAQEKLLNSYAVTKGFKVNKVFSISESASGRKQRATFIQMMNYVKQNGIKIIICEKVDRLTRNFKDAVLIDEWLEKDDERQVHLVKDSLVLHKNSRSQEKLNWGIRILFAKNYIDNLSEEVKKGQKEKIQQGWLPTKPPVGYLTIGEKGHKIHVIDTDKAPLVKKLFDLYATGTVSIRKLTSIMQQEGLTGYTGKPIVKSRIAQILSDPFYIGKMVWNNETHTGKHEPIITREVFYKVQALLKGKTTPKYNRHDYLFKGMLSCSECGGTITWEQQKGHIYGHCNHYRNCTQKAWTKEPEVEKQLMPVFKKLEIKSARILDWIRKALKDSAHDEITYSEASKNQLLKKDKQLNLRLKNAYYDKIDGNIDQDFYNSIKQDVEAELEIIATKLEAHNKAGIKSNDKGIQMLDLSQEAHFIYATAKPEAKRTLLKDIFASLKLDEGVLTYKLNQPYEIIQVMAQAVESSKQYFETEKGKYIFEPSNNIDRETQREYLSAYCPALLPRLDSNQGP